MAYAAMVDLKYFLVNTVYIFKPCFPPPSLKILESLIKEVKSFQEFVSGLDGSTRKRIKLSLQRITEEIRRFSHVFREHLTAQIPSGRGAGSLIPLEVEDLKQEILVFSEMLNKIKGEREADFGGNKPKMVGLSDVYNKLKQDIVLYSEESRTIFSIVGMAGIGKTTLAKAIFEDLDILEWYEYRVWVSVGKNCQLEEIPRRILAQLDPDGARNLVEGDEDVRLHFKEILGEKRYLIMLDDVWDVRVCHHLEGFLPFGEIGSTVILTSRSRHVARSARFVCETRLLNEKESWDLLREKVFGQKSCPPQLEKAGKKIAEKCDGLPLTIITLAGLLLKAPESLWIDVATRRKHQLFTDAYDEISKVLYPSYEDLPHRLKICFLYMAVFPPNYKIPRSRLTNLWIVEGFLEKNASKSSEDCDDERSEGVSSSDSHVEDSAMKYLEELVSSSVVMVYQQSTRRSLRKSVEATKSCGLHSSWWHLCCTEARKNNFFYVLIGREDRLGEGIESQSRLSIQNNVLFAIKDVYDSIEKNSASTAHSLLCFGPFHRYPVPICFSLRLLKNLDALNIRLYEFPFEVLQLDRLKYLALTCTGELPASISKLQNIQFLIVSRHHSVKSHGAPSYLPVEIWDMKELKHLQIMGSDLPDHVYDALLPNLVTLLDVSGHSCTKGIFERIPHLKKLGIRIELALDASEPLCCFDHISQLNKLEILKCVVVNPAECKFEVVSLPTSLPIFPLFLKKLTLSGLGYPWKKMRKIASLSCLEVLKLRYNAFRGPTWEVEESTFQKIRFLVIEDADLMQWKVGRGSFKVLEYISIKHCYKLKELHWEFYPRLCKIEVVDSNPSLEKQIAETMIRRRCLAEDLWTVNSSWDAEDHMP